MHRRGHGNLKNAILFLVGAGLLGVASVNGAAQPRRVIFSGSSTNDVMPSAEERERQLERIKNSSGRSSSPETIPDKPFIAPANSEGTTTFHNKKLQQLLEQRSNWIFETEDTAAKPLTSDELFGVVDTSTLLDGGKSKGLVERYFEKNRKEQTPSDKTSRNGAHDTLDSEDKESATAFDDDPLTNPGFRDRNSSRTKDKESGMDNATYSDPRRLPAASGANTGLTLEGKVILPGGSHSGFISAREERLRQDKLQADQRYYQLFHPGEVSPGLGTTGPNDPINQMVDTTRNPLQPTTAPSLTDLDALGNSRANNPFGSAPNTGFGARQGGLDALLSGRAFGSSSLSPTLMPPPAPIMVQPKPAVLEIPKRKF
jgi:hypothetical protein